MISERTAHPGTELTKKTQLVNRVLSYQTQMVSDQTWILVEEQDVRFEAFVVFFFLTKLACGFRHRCSLGRTRRGDNTQSRCDGFLWRVHDATTNTRS